MYLASTPGGRLVALKVVRPELGDNPEFRARFGQEVAAARRVDGLYTAQLLDADPQASPPWLVTAYVAGPSLTQVVAARGPLPTRTVLRVVAAVAEALAAIHAAGLVHRDLKPSNVLLAADGPRVIDFGLARAAEASGLTRTGMRVGSAQYMAPEQVRGDAVGPAADVWALGAVAVFAATARPLFGEGSDMAVLYRVLHEQPDLASCPEAVRAVIGQCLAADPATRPTPAQLISSCQASCVGKSGELGGGWQPLAVAAGPAGYAAAEPSAEPALPSASMSPLASALLSPPAQASASALPSALPSASALPSPASGVSVSEAVGEANPTPRGADAEPEQALGIANVKPPPPAGVPADGTPLRPRRRWTSATVAVATAASLVVLVALVGFSLRLLPDPQRLTAGRQPSAAGSPADAGHPAHSGAGVHPRSPPGHGHGMDLPSEGADEKGQPTGSSPAPSSTAVTSTTNGGGGSPPQFSPAIDPCLIGTWKASSIVIYSNFDGTGNGNKPDEYTSGYAEGVVGNWGSYTKTINANGSFAAEYTDLDLSDAWGNLLQASAENNVTGSETTNGGQELNTYTSDTFSIVYPTPATLTISGNATYTCSGNTLTETIADLQTDTMTREG